MAASPYPTTPWLRPPPLMGLLGLLLLLLVSLSPAIPLAGAGAGVLRQVVGGDDGGGTSFEPFNVTYDHRALILGGKRRMLVSAGLHYPRATPEMWPSLIAKAKEGGVDVIETYIFWNGHEPAKGQYYFEGRFDIVRFAKLVAAEGLFLFLRIGPYACAEWNFGGFPVWLRDIPGIEFRTDNEPYKAEMQNFVTKIVDIMKEEKLYSWQGGPIILQQIENEYGNIQGKYGQAGKIYMQWAAQMALALDTGVPWVMCRQTDAPEQILNTCNAFYCDGFTPNSYNKPTIWTEDWDGCCGGHAGAPLSALDGVLVGVKDEIDCLPYPTTGGTRWLGAARRCEADAACVAQLRACGAVLAGKANMHELGAGTSGINPHHGSTRNPYNASKVAGGSSSGSAAVVCAGLCPVALGVDGGGSVRMPAALCGVVGFKPTAGRLSNAGVLPLNWTVGMPGILAGTVEDALIAYSAIVDQSQPSYLRPELNLPQLSSTPSIGNIKLAKYGKWFNDSAEDIRSCCDKALQALHAHYGWQTVDVTIPEIEEMRLAHYVTIGSECTTSLAKYLDNLKRSEIGWDARVALSVYGSFSSRAYLNSQRLRNRQMYFHKQIFETADVIVSPMTGVTAYTLQDDARDTGELDYINGAALVRYSIAGNFLGLPAITVKVGYDRGGLPIGLQFIGRPWSEATLLHVAFATQQACANGYKKPAVFYDLLTKQQE